MLCGMCCVACVVCDGDFYYSFVYPRSDNHPHKATQPGTCRETTSELEQVSAQQSSATHSKGWHVCGREDLRLS